MNAKQMTAINSNEMILSAVNQGMDPTMAKWQLTDIVDMMTESKQPAALLHFGYISESRAAKMEAAFSA